MTTGSSAWSPSTMTRGAPEPAGGLGTFLRAGLDERSVCFLARLSPRYPAVEARVADVCPNAGTAALAAAAAGARRGRSRPVHRAGRRCAGPPLPPARSCLPRAHRARRHRDDHQAAAPARPAGDRSRPPANPVHQRRIHARVHHRTRPRDAVRLRTGAAPAADGPGRAREPGRTAIRATAGAGDRRPGTGHRCGADRRVGRCRGRAGAGFSRLPAAKAIRAMIRAATAGTAVTSAVMAQLRQGQG